MLSGKDRAVIKALIGEVLDHRETVERFSDLDARAQVVADRPLTGRELEAAVAAAPRSAAPLKPGDCLYASVDYEPERTAEDVAHERARREAFALASAVDANLEGLLACVSVTPEDPADTESRNIMQKALDRLRP